jgi:hypothetical protein
MSDETVQEPGGKRNESAASDFEDDETVIADRSDWGSFLRRQVPYISVLGLAIVGVAYTNMAHQPARRLLGVFGTCDGRCLHHHRVAKA